MIKKYIVFAFILSIVIVLIACSTTKSQQENKDENKVDIEKIVDEALKNEHEHVWVEDGFQELHPHRQKFKCACGATAVMGDKTADFTMTIVGVSKEHPII